MEAIKNEFFYFTNLRLSHKIPEFRVFEDALFKINVESVKSVLDSVKKLSTRLLEEDDCLYADVQIVKSYLEKMVCVVDHFADNDLFREINMDACNYYKMHPYITSKNLFEVLEAANITIDVEVDDA